MKHAVVLLNYKGWQDTILCIDSIKQTEDTPHIIVVDNASPDDSVEKIRAKHPDIELIVSRENLGFSGGNNLGIRSALQQGVEVIHILNNDTLVDKSAFTEGYKTVAGKNVIAGAKIYYAKGFEYHQNQKNKGNIIWYAGGYMDWQAVIARHYGIDEEDKGQLDQPKEVDFITGCYMAVPAKVFDQIGLLDEKFFLYLEDLDFTLKAKKAGVKTLYQPTIKIYHRNSSSTGVGSPLVDYYLTRNRFLIGWRYGGLRLTLALIKEALTRNWSSPIRRAAFFDFLFNRFGNKNDKIARISRS